MDELKILLAAANPDKNKLRLDEEQRDIVERVERAERQQQKGPASRSARPIAFHSVGATRLRDLITALQLHRPHVLHFSGHGAAQSQLVFLNEHGGRAIVSPRDVADVLSEFTDSLQLLFFNACYSLELAQGATERIDAAVAMSGPIEDPCALTFAAAFYNYVALGSSVGKAFRLARLEMANSPDCADSRAVPQLVHREGTDPEALCLLSRPDERDPALSLPPLTNTTIRTLIDKYLPTDEDLLAFLHDHYPVVARRLGSGTNRMAKVTLLLVCELDLATIHRRVMAFSQQHLTARPADLERVI